MGYGEKKGWDYLGVETARREARARCSLPVGKLAGLLRSPLQPPPPAVALHIPPRPTLDYSPLSGLC